MSQDHPLPADVFGIAWHPVGDYLAVGFGDGLVRMLDLRTRQWRDIARHPTVVKDVVFHPQGNLLATSCFDGKTRFWSPGSAVALLQIEAGFPRQFSLDGGRLAFDRLDNGSGTWELQTSAVCEFVGTADGGSQIVDGVTFSPDGRWLAAAGPEGVAIVEPARGLTITNLAGADSHFALLYPGENVLLMGARTGLVVWPYGLGPTPPEAEQPG